MINISWNDELAESLRKRFREIIKTVAEVLSEKIEDENLVREILLEIGERSKKLGNFDTIKDSNTTLY